MSRYKTIKEATEIWVHEMNAIPQGCEINATTECNLR